MAGDYSGEARVHLNQYQIDNLIHYNVPVLVDVVVDVVITIAECVGKDRC
ncbi:MAG: hypothetical protein ACR2PB_08390 [Desulfocapsaceae bacterium]